MSGVHLLSETTLSGHSTPYEVNGTSSMSRGQDQIKAVMPPPLSHLKVFRHGLQREARRLRH